LVNVTSSKATLNSVEDFESLKQLKSKMPERHLNPVFQLTAAKYILKASYKFMKFGNIYIMFDAESGFENRITCPQCGNFGYFRFNLEICQQRCFGVDFIFFVPTANKSHDSTDVGTTSDH
jgi:hypothetical protein